jgi:dihydroxyacetone kinase-like protein
MLDSVRAEDLVRMLRGGLEAVRSNHEYLSKLDAATGDGDHGSAMLRAVAAAEEAIRKGDPSDLGAMLQAVGWGVMGATGGAPGPLLGSFFTGMSASAALTEFDCRAVASLFESGLANLREQTRAQVGDKTLIDALVPAIEALRAAAEAGRGVDEALASAAEAADRGADATTQMRARFGKARNLGERSAGTLDPGAVTVSCMFIGFVQGMRPGSETTKPGSAIRYA